MSTLVSVTPGFLSDGVAGGGAAIFTARSRPSNAELALFAEPSLVSCLLPENYAGEDKWSDAIGALPYVLASGAKAPSLITSGGVNGRPYLKYGASSNLGAGSPFLAPAGSTYWPVGADYTLVALLKSDADNGGSNGVILGNDRATTTADNGTINGCSRLYYLTTNGQIALHHRSNLADGSNNPTRVLNSPSGAPFTPATGLNAVIVSFKQGSPSTAAMRVNASQVAANANVAEPNRSSRLIVGGNFDGVTFANGLRYGEIYGVLAFNIALHDPANAAVLAKLNDFISARWGIF